MKHNNMIHTENLSFIRHVHGMRDVFFGQGYNQHARIRIHYNPMTNKKRIEHIEGIILTPWHRKVILTEI